MNWPTCTRCGHPGEPFYAWTGFAVLCDFHHTAWFWGEAWAHARARLLAFCGRWDNPGAIPEAEEWEKATR